MDTVQRIVDKQLNLTVHGYELVPDDDLWNLGMTSLTCLGLMLTIEDTFAIELPEESLKQSTFRSVRSITAAVEGVRNGRREAEDGERVPSQT
jgi:acyl carrier protein